MILETTTIYLTRVNENLGEKPQEIIGKVAISMADVKYVAQMYYNNKIHKKECCVNIGNQEISIAMPYEEMLSIWKEYKSKQ